MHAHFTKEKSFLLFKIQVLHEDITKKILDVKFEVNPERLFMKKFAWSVLDPFDPGVRRRKNKVTKYGDLYASFGIVFYQTVEKLSYAEFEIRMKDFRNKFGRLQLGLFWREYIKI